MRLQIDYGETSRVMAVSIDDAKAVVGDLVDAVGLDVNRSTWINELFVANDVLLGQSGLVEGSALTQSKPDDSSSAPRILGVSSGPDAGRWVDFSAGEATAGRAPDNDLVINNGTVSAHHIRLQPAGAMIEAFDTDSKNGTWVDDEAIAGSAILDSGQEIRLGSSKVTVFEIGQTDKPIGLSAASSDSGGRSLFNRPPRDLIPLGPHAVLVPEPKPTRSKPVFSVVSLIVPVLFATVMIVVTGRWQFAIFALLSPLMVIGNYVTQRRRVKAQRKDDTESYEEGMLRFERELATAQAIEQRRRKDRAPGLLEVRRRVAVPSNRLWERRLDSVDALTFGLGRGDVRWDIPLESSRNGETDDLIDEQIDRHNELLDAPLLVDLREGPLGLVGSTEQAPALARAVLTQLATFHGPADISIAILTRPDRLDEWKWAAWLPHSNDSRGAITVLAGEAAAAFASSVNTSLNEDESGLSRGLPMSDPAWLIVVDDTELLHGRGSPARQLLGRTAQRVHGIVLADTEDQLPASTASIAELEHDGSFRMWTTAAGRGSQGEGVADFVSADVAEDIARSMARFEDPDSNVLGGLLPASVSPDAIWGDSVGRVEVISDAWLVNRASPSLNAVIGVSETGPEIIDLVADGPHGLIAGTTGAGKSEFLRTFVASLSRSYSPDDLVFVLIDYKGGSAFDCCSDLPHVVGMVTDLDDHLAERALVSMEAELHHREQLLRDHAASDISEYRRMDSPGGPLPRLVVVIDEFATLRAELPDFVTSLIGIAQRGRSLGVHLILATQRPSGAVDANIRANTNLRVALRVQDAGDSTDVIDTKDAASLARDTPGRAYVRRGQSDLVAVQTAYVSGPRISKVTVPVRVAPVDVGSGAPTTFPKQTVESEDTYLAVLVRTVTEAFGECELPRRPWLDDVAARLDPESVLKLPAGDTSQVVFAVGDDPEKQRHVALGWSPSDGHLLVHGVLGSGVSTTLRSLVHRLASGVSGRPAWVFAADHAAGGLRDIAMLSHVSCVLEPTEVGRHARLLTMLLAMLDERRELSAIEASKLPLAVLVVDGVAGFAEVTETGTSGDRTDEFTRIVRDGPAVGIVVVAGGNRPAEAPRSLTAATRQHVVHELADVGEYQMLGIRARSLPTFRPGRVLLGSKPTVAQVVDWSASLIPPIPNAPSPPEVSLLAESVGRAELQASASLDGALAIPIGLAEDSRSPAFLKLRGGEHALVAGPAGSGKTTTLRTIAHSLRAADPSVVIVGIAPSADAPLFDANDINLFDAGGMVEDISSVLAKAKDEDRRWVILIDDADRIELDGGPLVELARNARSGVTIVAAGRSSAVRSTYGHWIRHIRTSGVGVILNPDNGVDGELLAVRLPRGERLLVTPGRGYLVQAGEAKVIQTAR